MSQNFVFHINGHDDDDDGDDDNNFFSFPLPSGTAVQQQKSHLLFRLRNLIGTIMSFTTIKMLIRCSKYE